MVDGISPVVTMDKCPIVWLMSSYMTKDTLDTSCINMERSSCYFLVSGIRALAL